MLIRIHQSSHKNALDHIARWKRDILKKKNLCIATEHTKGGVKNKIAKNMVCIVTLHIEHRKIKWNQNIFTTKNGGWTGLKITLYINHLVQLYYAVTIYDGIFWIKTCLTWWINWYIMLEIHLFIFSYDSYCFLVVV